MPWRTSRLSKARANRTGGHPRPPQKFTFFEVPGLHSHTAKCPVPDPRGLISAGAPPHGGEIFLGAVGAFGMDSHAARAWDGQPIALGTLRFSGGPQLPEPHERSCSRGF